MLALALTLAATKFPTDIPNACVAFAEFTLAAVRIPEVPMGPDTYILALALTLAAVRVPVVPIGPVAYTFAVAFTLAAMSDPFAYTVP
jgi:hypothetical protein